MKAKIQNDKLNIKQGKDRFGYYCQIELELDGKTYNKSSTSKKELDKNILPTLLLSLYKEISNDN